MINQVDEYRLVKHRLYKHHIGPKGKDPTMIGRQLNTLIILDTQQTNPDPNTLEISPWKGQPNDALLAELCPLLASIAIKRLSTLESL